MAITAAQQRAEQQLLDSFNRYDQYADVVSAFEFLFTETREMPVCVERFERFPGIMHPVDGRRATPDFTVSFHQGNNLGNCSGSRVSVGAVTSL